MLHLREAGGRGGARSQDLQPLRPQMHMNDGQVVSNFILQVLQGEPLMVYGSGSQMKAFQ